MHGVLEAASLPFVDHGVDVEHEGGFVAAPHVDGGVIHPAADIVGRGDDVEYLEPFDALLAQASVVEGVGYLCEIGVGKKGLHGLVLVCFIRVYVHSVPHCDAQALYVRYVYFVHKLVLNRA